MLDFFKVITVNHKKLKTEDLEYFVLRHKGDDELAIILKELVHKTGQEEVVYLNTCNRIIFLLYGPHLLTQEEATEVFTGLNPDLENYEGTHISKLVDVYWGIEAIRHIFEVASSLDSLVVGEREIFRQFRQAYNRCAGLGLTGDHLRLAEKCTVRAAKDVYTNTDISKKPVSVVSLVMQKFLSAALSKDARILLIGSGETNTAVGRLLHKYGYHKLTIFNRTIDNALALSNELGAEALHLADLSSYNQNFDCLFACTGSQEAIVDLPLYKTFPVAKRKRILVDLSVPRNITERVATLGDVEYISIDDISEQARQNHQFRSGNIAASKIILNKHLEEFIALYNRRKMEKAFKKLPLEIERIKERALKKVYKDQIDEMPDSARQLIEEIVEYMEKKCVAIPMKMARDSTQD